MPSGTRGPKTFRLIAAGFLAVCLLCASGCSRPPAPSGPTEGRAGDGEYPVDLVQRFGLGADYLVSLLHAPPVLQPQLTRSLGGTVFMHEASRSRVYRFNAASRTFVLVRQTEEPFLTLVGGPDDTALLVYPEVIMQLLPDGTSREWGVFPHGMALHCLVYAPGGLLIASSPDGRSVVGAPAQGDLRVLADGFGSVHDIAAGRSGELYVADAQSGQVSRIEADGTVALVLQGSPDPLNIDVGPRGQLWVNNIATGFAKVDLSSGATEQWWAENSECRVVHTPGRFLFLPDGLVLFAAVTGEITWADIAARDGGHVLSTEGANSPALAIGPEGFLCFGVDECSGQRPAQVVRVSDHLDRDVLVEGLAGSVVDIAFDTGGTLYMLTLRKESHALHYLAGAGEPAEIPLADPAAAHTSIAVNPCDDRLLIAGAGCLYEYSQEGYLGRHELAFPEGVFSFKIAGNLAGDVFIAADAADGFFTGPVVRRWLYRLDLDDYSLRQWAQIDLLGCGPVSNLAVDPLGHAWWLLNPDFCLYRITAPDDVTLFAQNLFVDPAGVAVDAEGDVYFSSPEGIYRIHKR